MEGRRCRDVIWGEETRQCYGGEEAPDHTEREKERGRERAQGAGYHSRRTLQENEKS